MSPATFYSGNLDEMRLSFWSEGAIFPSCTLLGRNADVARQNTLLSEVGEGRRYFLPVNLPASHRGFWKGTLGITMQVLYKV